MLTPKGALSGENPLFYTPRGKCVAAAAKGAAYQGSPDKSVQAASILLVHRLAVLRVGLRSVLAGTPQFRICGETDDAAEARDLFMREKPDLVVLGLTLRGGTEGIFLMRELVALRSGLPVVVMTQRSDALSCRRAFHAGAQGYVAAQDAISELPHALAEVLAGRRYASPSGMQQLLTSFSPSAPRCRRRIERLSDREFQVFRLIGAGMGPTRAAHELHVSVKTVETHYTHIKSKLQITSTEDLKRQAALFLKRESNVAEGE